MSVEDKRHGTISEIHFALFTVEAYTAFVAALEKVAMVNSEIRLMDDAG